jgi:hypothetical protein
MSIVVFRNIKCQAIPYHDNTILYSMYFIKGIAFLWEAIYDMQDFNDIEKFYYVMFKPGEEWVVYVTCFIVPEISCDCIVLFILWLYYSFCKI